MDSEIQNAVMNPYRDGVGGIAFDTDEEGSYEGTESGELAFLELSYSDLQASLAGTVATTQWVVVNATNTEIGRASCRERGWESVGAAGRKGKRRGGVH